MSGTRYTTLSPAALADEFSTMARDTTAVFGRYSAAELNWQPRPESWSIAQCFDHLVKADDEMFQAIGRALDPAVALTIWQRLPLWPRLFGWMLVTSQAPGGKQKFTAPEIARPAASAIAPDVIERFVARQHLGIDKVQKLSAQDARRILVSPFVSRVTYSVLDGYRLIVAHQRRHFEQAARVAGHPAFPGVRPAASTTSR